MPDLILAIDQGTHSTRALVFDAQGHAVCSERQSIALQRHSRSEIEQSPGEILQSMQTVITSVLDNPAIDRQRISCAGLATQRSSVVAWDRRSGLPLSPVISWQDRRTADTLHRLEDKSYSIQQLTGLQLSPHYGATKLQWLLDNNAAVAAALEADRLVMGPLASYLLHHLTDNVAELVDDANASRTQLWNQQWRDWDSTLLEYFDIPLRVLPHCKPICCDYGSVQGTAIPVRAVNGDQTAALYAQGIPSGNTVTINIGTGAFVLLPTADPGSRPDGLLAGISLSNEASGSYYIEGTVNAAGAALEWAAASFGASDYEQQLPGWLQAITTPTLFINTLGGLGSPWWQEGPAAHFIDSGVSGPEAMVAVIESILFLLQANIILLQNVNPAIDRIQISGGLSRLDGLCQKLANLSALAVYRPVHLEATARGIAWQAAGSAADWPPAEEGSTFTPTVDCGLNDRYSRFVEILNKL
ncbi:MAG: FGGY family carbohydrate kinase [Gammaproteobacteria bacterium]